MKGKEEHRKTRRSRLDTMWIKTSPRPIREDVIASAAESGDGSSSKSGGKGGSPPGRFFDFSRLGSEEPM
jgi:hypothetical protein